MQSGNSYLAQNNVGIFSAQGENRDKIRIMEDKCALQIHMLVIVSNLLMIILTCRLQKYYSLPLQI